MARNEKESHKIKKYKNWFIRASLQPITWERTGFFYFLKLRRKDHTMKNISKNKNLENHNRFLSLKESFLEAFEAIGGTKGLVEWAKKNPDKFYPMAVRILLKETKPFKLPAGFMRMS